MDLNITVRYVAKAAQRALGVLVAKSKSQGGLPFRVFTNIYDSRAQPILDYGAAIWGHKSFSCIQAVQNRAMRYYLGVGRGTPNVAVQGDMGWSCNEQRQWMCVSRQWCRLIKMAETCINKVIFKWAYQLAIKGKKNIKTLTMDFYNRIGMNHLSNITNEPVFSSIKNDLKRVLSEHFEIIWFGKLTR